MPTKQNTTETNIAIQFNLIEEPWIGNSNICMKFIISFSDIERSSIG